MARAGLAQQGPRKAQQLALANLCKARFVLEVGAEAVALPGVWGGDDGTAERAPVQAKARSRVQWLPASSRELKLQFLLGTKGRAPPPARAPTFTISKQVAHVKCAWTCQEVSFSFSLSSEAWFLGLSTSDQRCKAKYAQDSTPRTLFNPQTR